MTKQSFVSVIFILVFASAAYSANSLIGHKAKLTPKFDELQSDSVSFTNTNHNFTFNYPKTLDVKGASEVYLPEDDSTVYISDGTEILFSLEYLYPSDEEMGIEIQSDNKAGRTSEKQQWREYVEIRDKNNAEERKYRDLPLLRFAEMVREAQIMSASTSPDKQDAPLRMTLIDGLPAYQYTQLENVRFNDESIPLKMGRTFSFAMDRFVLLEDPSGAKLYLRYRSTNPISERILESIRFNR